MSALAWIVGPLAILAAICALPWLCSYLLRSLIYHWRNAPTGGSPFNPLQEFIQPQVRHVVEVREQRLNEDDEGAPPLPACPAINDESIDSSPD
jgi:hypothetical protein